jgi:CRISPR/Cas system-associated exonuclease Cas4 (RecB family)
MELHKDVPIKTFTKFERFERVVPDNSALSEYKKCPRRYFFRYVLGYTTKTLQPYFPFGTAYHKFRELLEQYRNENLKKDMSNDMATVLASPPALDGAIKCYEAEIKGKELASGKYDFLDLKRLKESCLHVFNHWRKEKLLGTIKVLSSEQAFSIQLKNGMFIGGRFDEIIENNGKVMGRDFKTSTIQAAYYKKGLVPNPQFLLYTKAQTVLHGKDTEGQIVEVLFNMKTTKPSLQPFPVRPTKQQLSEWEDGTIYYLEQINNSREKDFYPMNESACWACPFHEVCSMPSETSQTSILKSRFKHELWDYSKGDV